MSAAVAVLDIGKTNVKLWVAGPDGALLDHRSVANTVRPGPPWRHHDLDGLGAWLGRTLAGFCRHHDVRALVPVGHGSGGVLVGADGPALPMIDYEQDCPAEVDAAYAREAGTFEDRGSPVMMASTHAARQLLWMETAQPGAVASARHYLNVAQYWGWWLSGVAASEYSAMGAQSHFWNVPQRRWTPIVQGHGWARLMPAFRSAWAPLGPVRADLARRFGLPEGIEVLTGAHDSSANFYRYLAAGLTGFTLVSTGTWIVAMSREADTGALDQRRSTTINADMEGRPVGGALTMGGREFSALAGPDWAGQGASLETVQRIVARGTMALPSFGDSEGQFPGSARRGRILGPAPETQEERTALALVHSALLTVACAEVLGGGDRLILDGAFLAEPLFAPLVAALRPVRITQTSDEPQGVVAGAVLLVGHSARRAPAPMALEVVAPLAVPGLESYAKHWRDTAETTWVKGQKR